MLVAIFSNNKECIYRWSCLLKEENIKFILCGYDEVPDISCKDVVFFDTTIGANESSSLIKNLKNFTPLIIAFSQIPDFEDGKMLLISGARAYMNSNSAKIYIIDAIKSLQNGQIWLFPEFVEKMIFAMGKTQNTQNKTTLLDQLTPKEKSIAKLIIQGHSNKDIAKMLEISVRTVKAHSGEIYKKLDVKDRIGLVLHLKNVL